jgi:hypothetical protein
MLRIAVITISVLLLAVGVGCFVLGRAEPGLISVVLAPALILIGTVFERRYKKPLAAPPGPDWQATPEKFIDPGTAEPLVVYFQPSTGKRVYVRAERGRAPT